MMVIEVELFILFWVLTFLMLVGMLVLLYFYQNRNGISYVMRGGRSDIGLDCGSFRIFMAISSLNGWYRGAALSYKYQNRNYERYFFRGGRSSNGAYCGAFFVVATDAASYASWGLGAALSYKVSKSKCFRRLFYSRWTYWFWK